MADLIILPPAAKYLKKLKDKQLKKLYDDAIKEIRNDPSIGMPKHGDLKGVIGYDIYYNKINYELAYTVEYRINSNSGETEVVVVIMAGTRENFYDELKRYWR
ncbi:MAG: type II toxin-antitoxin system RelE/ParE family toxin [Clostridiales bacterium]|nr:type II toxin-antitoxin system RelE/ParE family toxin [Clostridiales bacterium]